MRIIAVYTTKDAGYPSEQAYMERHYELGKEYEVEKIVVHSFSTDVWLKGDKKVLNSVFFTFYKDGEPYDPTDDVNNWYQKPKEHGGKKQ